MFKNEKGFTLLEMIFVLIIMGIIAAISFPIFTTTNDVLSEKTIYNQFMSVYQKTSTDASSLVVKTSITIQDGYYEIKMDDAAEEEIKKSRANKNVTMVGNVKPLPSDVGKVINFDEKGQVTNDPPISFTLQYRKTDYLFEVKKGVKNITINGQKLF